LSSTGPKWGEVMNSPNLIVVGVDGTDGSRRALQWALTEAGRRGADVEAVTVWTWEGLEGPMLALTTPVARREHADRLSEREVETALAHCPARVRVHRTVVEGYPTMRLVEAARRARLLVVGSHGHGRLHRAVRGSISAACVRHSPCPVVVVPPTGPTSNPVEPTTRVDHVPV
jgi:nucleotide-binding universal stress UspA family protein